MVMLQLSEKTAARLNSVAAARGVTPAELVEELVTDALPATDQTASDRDLLEAFIGCGASGDRRDRSIQELRDELSTAQLDRTA